MTAPVRCKVRPKKIAVNQPSREERRSLPVSPDEDGFCWVLSHEGWDRYFAKLMEWQKGPPRRFERIFRWSPLDAAWVVMLYRDKHLLKLGEHVCETKITGSSDEKHQIRAIHAQKLTAYPALLPYARIL